MTAGKDLVNIGNLVHDLICANANLILAVVAPFGLAGGWTLDYANTLCVIEPSRARRFDLIPEAAGRGRGGRNLRVYDSLYRYM